MQQIRDMIVQARGAQAIYQARFDQEAADRVVRLAALAIFNDAERLARMAVDETGMGVYEDKVAKNRNKSKGIWNNLKGKASMGIMGIDPVTGLMEIAKPIGVVAGITPMTNPIVTPMSKILFALKTRNAIIISPHPKAKMCSAEAVRRILAAIEPAGVPAGMVQVIEEPTLESTQELMRECDTVVATGGMPMVRAAYSSGKPSFGVGAGNVQVIFDRDIDYGAAAAKVVAGRSFDNGIICSGEQCVAYPRDRRDEVMVAFGRAGGYVVGDEDRDKVVGAIFDQGAMVRDMVGRSAVEIARRAGVEVPEGTKVLVVEARGAGEADVVCREKMFPVLAAVAYDTFDEAVAIARTNLAMEGSGHTAGIHSNSQANIIKAGTELSVSRVIVNAVCATTAGGSMQNGLAVTNTLGCGSWGNNSISENFTYKHLLNITRIAPLSSKMRVPADDEIWG